MAIKRPAQMDFSEKKFTLIIAGPPGVGKTTVAMSAPNPILFDLDNGVSRLRAEHRGLTVTNDTYEGLLEDMKSEEYEQAESVIIDTGGSLVQLMQPWAKLQDNKAARDGRAMFGVIKREFDRLTHQIRSIDRKNLIIVFHTTEQQKGDIITTRLSCEGSAKDIVWTPADLGCYMYIEGGTRKMGFTPTEEYFAKGCFGITGVWDVPALNLTAQNNFLTRLFAAAQRNIAEEMKAYTVQREQYNKCMAGGESLIRGAASLEDLNAAKATIAEMPHALTSKSELARMLGERAKELGATYNKEVGAYVAVSADGKPA